MKQALLGAIVPLADLLEDGADTLRRYDLNCCQVNCWDDALMTRDNAERLLEKTQGIALVGLWAGWPGPKAWNFTEGPATLGLVPRDWRQRRLEALYKAAEFATWMGVTDVVTHIGFIPENPSTTEYLDFIACLRPLVQDYRAKGLCFGFETGQETPITLLRTIQDLGGEGLCINLDPANLLMYGKANPVDAVSIYGPYIHSVHVKDGLYPTNGQELGQEMPVGEGRVNFPALLPALYQYGFEGSYVIEREITGPQQGPDILKARDLIRSILATL